MEKLVSDLDPEQVKALTDLMTLLQQGAAARKGENGAHRCRRTRVLLAQGYKRLPEDSVPWSASHFLNLPDLFTGLFASIGALFAGSVAGPIHILLGSVALILAAGFAAEFLVNRIFAAKRDRIQSRQPESLFETVKLVSTRAGLDLGGLMVFAIVAVIVGRLAVFDPVTRSFALQAVFWIVFMPRLVAALLRFALAPHRRELRLVTADDATAKSLYRSFTTLVCRGRRGLFPAQHDAGRR